MDIEFGQILRKLRKLRGETLDQVASSTGLSIAMLSRLERGERLPSPDSVHVLAEHFGLPADELLGEAMAQRLNRLPRKSADVAASRFMRSASDVHREPPIRYGAFEARSIEELGSTRTSAPRPREPESEMTSGSMSYSLAAPSTPASTHTVRTARPDSSREHVDLAVSATRIAVRELAELLSDASDEARLEAVRGLASIADHPAAILVRLAHYDPDAGVRQAAREVLESWGIEE